MEGKETDLKGKKEEDKVGEGGVNGKKEKGNLKARRGTKKGEEMMSKERLRVGEIEQHQ